MLKCQKYIKQVSSDDPIWDNVMKFAADHLVSMNIVEFCYRCSKTVTSDRLLNFSRGLLNRRARPRSPTSDIRLEFIRASIEGLNENEIVINDKSINDCLRYIYNTLSLRINVSWNCINVTESYCPEINSVSISNEELRLNLIKWFPTYDKLKTLEIKKISTMCLVDHT